MKNHTDWVQATAPLNVFVQFDHQENNEWRSEEVSFTIVCPYISCESYVDQQVEDAARSSEGNEADGFSFVCCMGAVILVIWMVRKYHWSFQ